jgi:hypothetical protein
MLYECVAIFGIVLVAAIYLLRLNKSINKTEILIELLRKKTLLRKLYFAGFEVVEATPKDGVRQFGIKHIGESMAYVPPIDVLIPHLLTDDLDEVFSECVMKGEEIWPGSYTTICVRALQVPA